MDARRVDLTSSVVVVAAGRSIEGADAVLAGAGARAPGLPLVHRVVGGGAACAPANGLLLLAHRGSCVGDPVAEVSSWLRDAVAAAVAAGVPAHRLVVDAGLDTKPWDEALALLRATPVLAPPGTPMAVATLGDAWRDVGRRVGGQALAVAQGCRVLLTADPVGARRVADVVLAVERA